MSNHVKVVIVLSILLQKIAIYILSFCVRYGMQIDPINMDEMMGPMDIPIQQGFIHSKARIEGIEIHGLGSMALDKVFLLLV